MEIFVFWILINKTKFTEIYRGIFLMKIQQVQPSRILLYLSLFIFVSTRCVNKLIRKAVKIEICLFLKGFCLKRQRLITTKTQ